jgi:hypothetical protein
VGAITASNIIRSMDPRLLKKHQLALDAAGEVHALKRLRRARTRARSLKSKAPAKNVLAQARRGGLGKAPAVRSGLGAARAAQPKSGDTSWDDLCPARALFAVVGIAARGRMRLQHRAMPCVAGGAVEGPRKV